MEIMNRFIFWIAPASTSALAAVVYGPFGFGRDFGVFIISLFFVLPGLAVFLVVIGLWALLERRARWLAITRSLFIAGFVPALLIPALWVFGDPIRDPARYAVWSAFHRRELDNARGRDGVFKHWDGWGMAGNDNDSYLASDPTDTLARPGVAARWAKDHRLGCDIVLVRRMGRGVYLLTTSNCPLTASPFASLPSKAPAIAPPPALSLIGAHSSANWKFMDGHPEGLEGKAFAISP
jgi:hypothetical protein